MLSRTSEKPDLYRFWSFSSASSAMTCTNTIWSDYNTGLLSCNHHFCKDIFTWLLIHTRDTHNFPAPVLLDAVSLFDSSHNLQSRASLLSSSWTTPKPHREGFVKKIFGNECRHPDVCPDGSFSPINPLSSTLHKMISALLLRAQIDCRVL